MPLKDVAPSTELRRWFSHDPSKWIEFQRRYSAELDAKPESVEPIFEADRRGRVTLVYSSHHEEHNNAVALRATSHHRGQQLAMLRTLGRDLHSNYDPTADTGGLMQSCAPTIYAYPSLEALLQGESAGGAKSKSPGPPADRPATERPGEK